MDTLTGIKKQLSCHTTLPRELPGRLTATTTQLSFGDITHTTQVTPLVIKCPPPSNPSCGGSQLLPSLSPHPTTRTLPPASLFRGWGPRDDLLKPLTRLHGRILNDEEGDTWKHPPGFRAEPAFKHFHVSGPMLPPVVPNVWSREPWGVPQSPLGGWSMKSNHFHENSKISCFFTLTLSQVCCRVFQKLHNVCYCNRLNAAADTRIQPSSTKPDSKEIWQKRKPVPRFRLVFGK